MSASGRRRFSIGLALTLVAAAFACGLGVWQVKRLAWKEDLLARLAAGRAGPAAPLPPAADWGRLASGDPEYRRFAASGRFEPKQALVFAGPVETPQGVKPGYYVMGALDLDGGGRLLVHRGVIPIEMKDAPPAPPTGETKVVGLFRAPERGTWFTPADVPAKGEFFLRDPALLAPAMGAGLSPFFLDEEADKGGGGQLWPRKGVGTQAPPNNHLSYALTWFGLALTLLVVAWLNGRKRREPDFPPTPET